MPLPGNNIKSKLSISQYANKIYVDPFYGNIGICKLKVAKTVYLSCKTFAKCSHLDEKGCLKGSLFCI